MKIYFAGPLFTTAERDFNRTVVALLREKGHEVFLPQEQDEEARDEGVSAQAIFKNDCKGILWCDVVVANMDGTDPDSGTCWECGTAWQAGKPVVLYRTDVREESEPLGPFNLMLHQSAAAVLICKWSSCAEVASMLDTELRQLPKKEGPHV